VFCCDVALHGRSASRGRPQYSTPLYECGKADCPTAYVIAWLESRDCSITPSAPSTFLLVFCVSCGLRVTHWPTPLRTSDNPTNERRDDNIEVGADLYEIDSEATATVVAGESPSAEINAGDASGESEAVVAASETKTESSKSSHRVPSIKFLGKEGWAKRLSPSTAADASSSDGQPPVIYGDIPPNFGRPVFTEEEMDALVQGGANLAPEVREHSGGALFG